MKTVLLRVGKRGSSWESTDPEEIIELEFESRDGNLELNPSVYELELEEGVELPPDVLRTHAEHAASWLKSPKGCVDADLHGLCGAAVAQGEGRFAFTNSVHRELVLRDRDALRAVIRSLLPQLQGRSYKLEKRDVLAYAAERLAADDPEWRAALAPADRSEWRDDLSRFAKRKS